MDQNAPLAPSSEYIKKQAAAKVWQRGCELVSGRNLSGLTRAGDELFGRCAGSYGEPYQLYARLQNGEVAEASCSCPFEGGGWCKHLVALVLRYAATPDDFGALPALNELIGALERDELNALVESWVRRSPELLNALTLSVNVKSGSADAGASLRSTLRGALAGNGADEARPALEVAVKRATKLENAHDWAGAGEVWRVLLEEIVRAVPHFERIIEGEDDHYDGGWHREYEEIDVGEEWAQLAVAGLNRVLEVETLAPGLRETLLRVLWKAWNESENFSYFSLPEEALDHVYDAAPPALWAEVEASLLEQLQGNRVDDFHREAALESLIYGLQQRDQGARADALRRQYGSYRQQLALLMEAKDYAAAEQLALQNESSQSPNLLNVADDLEQVGETERALKLAKRAQSRAHAIAPPAATQWLANFYTRHNQPADAAREAAALFVRRPDAQSLEIWKAAIALNGDWEQRYSSLEKSPALTPLLRVKLAMLDKRAARALELWGELSAREQAPLIEDLARVCETDLPAKAIELYLQMGENALAQSQQGYGNARPSYRAAAGYWKRARELHKRLGTMDEWVNYVRARREDNKRRPAFLDELKQAGL